MELIVLTALAAFLPFLSPKDPGPGLARSRSDARRLECERTSSQAGKRRFPGRIKTSAPRGDYIARDAVICRERLLRAGTRAPLDEAILSELDTRMSEIASAASSLRPDLADHTWLVETYYPSAPVSAKIGFASKNALMDAGLKVSDRTPALSAGDVDVITRMKPSLAYPVACQRYHDTGGIRDGDVLLGIVLRDPRETQLHAGLCVQGQWSWIR